MAYGLLTTGWRPTFRSPSAAQQAAREVAKLRKKGHAVARS